MSMNMIWVRAIQGRVARMEPKGVYIPHDKYVLAPHTRYIDRLIHHHGDIEVRPGSIRAAAGEPSMPAPIQPTPVVPEPDTDSPTIVNNDPPVKKLTK